MLELVREFDEWRKLRDQYVQFSKDYPMGWKDFGCKAPDKFLPAEDAHHLAPWHISVIGALGDSLTAARSSLAKSLIDTSNEYRGMNFVSGGDNCLNTRATLGNIFKTFNPDIKGLSKGISSENSTEKARFNLAKSGGFSYDLLWETIELVNRIKLDKSIHFDKDWKFINLFIGTNNLCYFCKDKQTLGPEKYFEDLKNSIEYLRANLPRVFLNLMPSFHVEIISELNEMSSFCKVVHRKNCPCTFEMSKEEYANIKKEFDAKLDLFNSVEYQRPDFAIVVSPAINISKLPFLGSTPNLAFIAADCFHFSEITHDFAAKEIWANLFEPFDRRHVVEDFENIRPDKWDCPPYNCSYLKTPLNSYNCSMAKYRAPSPPIRPINTFDIQYQSKVYLPSLNELERRANLNEQGTPFVFALFALTFFVVAFASAGVILQRRRREAKRRQSGERTPLLLTANLYDDQLF
ncbi:hypothetical protein WR25_05055 [Diploscapter pachys]|uniref:Uncharacterized protein n=1 Tax=Diploscapter pachys TaxID=2018661 RepID=A0A2A2J5B4_9BILA|nr:hypothetical protein WR25_05055 [Diploscapter pachys]